MALRNLILILNAFNPTRHTVDVDIHYGSWPQCSRTNSESVRPAPLSTTIIALPPDQSQPLTLTMLESVI